MDVAGSGGASGPFKVKKPTPPGSEAFLREQLEAAVKEIKALKGQVDGLEKENAALKRSVYDLSLRLRPTAGSRTAGSGGAGAGPGTTTTTTTATGAYFPSSASYNVASSSSTASSSNSASASSTSAAAAAATAAATSNAAGAGGGTAVFDLDAALEPAKALPVQAAAAPPMPTAAMPATARASDDSETTNTPNGLIGGGGKDARLFAYRHDLKGHTGAVYAVQFSPCGRFVASGSFDKSVRVWDALSPVELKRLEKHAMNVSDVAWSADSTALLSASFDASCIVWDVDSGKALSVHKTDSFVQCATFNPASPQVFFCGTTRKSLCRFDRRKGGDPIVTAHDAMINTLYVAQDGMTVITGDATGQIVTWDVRTNEKLSVVVNEGQRKPISHITASAPLKDGEEPRFLAVNSYDNVLRVYDRTASPTFALVHALRSHRHQNWPIRSAFMRSSDGMSFAASRSAPALDDNADDGPISGLDDGGRRRSSPTLTAKPTLLLATGSADGCAYIYDVGGREGTAELVQRLEGHLDRVYAVTFHPTKPLLATCSADFSVKLWNARSSSASGRGASYPTDYYG